MNSSAVFLFGIFSDNIKAELERNSKRILSYSSDALQKGLIEGLMDFFSEGRIINLPYVRAYPLGYKKTYCSESDFVFNNKDKVIKGVNCSFINIMVLRLYFRYKSAYRKLVEYFKDNNEKTTIFVYALHTPFLLAARAIKKKNPNSKLVVIVPDLPEYMSGSKNVLYRFSKFIERKVINYSLNSFDGFVLLTENMKEKLPINNKPYVIVEGIYYGNQVDENAHCQDENGKIVMYSGNLDQRHGILNLLYAFRKIDNKNAELIICGYGDTIPIINKICEEDLRIKYYGVIPREKVLEMQKRATLLVNPRNEAGEFTKYSFPSKTMEYLASGIPTLMYKLPGIPLEYYDYCFYLEDNSIEALSDKINEILQLPKNVLDAKGKVAQKFIMTQKNAKAQCGKIASLASRLYQ